MHNGKIVRRVSSSVGTNSGFGGNRISEYGEYGQKWAVFVFSKRKTVDFEGPNRVFALSGSKNRVKPVFQKPNPIPSRVVGRFLGTLPPLSSFLVNCSTMRKTVQRTGKCGSQQRTDAVDRPLPNKKTFPSISPSLDWSSSLPDLDLGMALHLEHGFHSGHFVRKTATKMLP